MKLFHKIAVIVAVLLLLGVTGIVSYHAGYSSAQKEYEGLQTFYAEIVEITDGYVLVDGLEENDINFRGQFMFTISEDTVLEWRYTAIESSDLEVGDRIAVTLKGLIQETSPARILEIVKIQLLEDEK